MKEINNKFKDFFRELSNAIGNEEITKKQFKSLVNDINISLNELEIELLEVEE